VPTAHALVDRFLTHLAGQVQAGRNKPATLQYYRRQLATLLTVLPPDLAAGDVAPHHLLDGPDTWHFHQAARRVFTWAAKLRLLKDDPLRGHPLPRPGRRERVPTPAERVAVLVAAAPFFRDYLVCLYHTAARPGELRALAWADVDLDQGTAELREYKAKGRMKHAPPVRTIFLDEAVVALLRRWKAERAPAPGDAVFTGRYGQPLTAQAVAVNFRRAVARAKVDQRGERLVPYSLRHGRATELTERGMQTRLLADLLGHSQERTTARYQHPRKQAVRDALLKFTAGPGR
jgi:integrase